MHTCSITPLFTPRSFEIRVIGVVTPHDAARVAELLQSNAYYGYARLTLCFSDARATSRGAAMLTQALSATRERGTHVCVRFDGPCSARVLALSPRERTTPKPRAVRVIGFDREPSR